MFDVIFLYILRTKTKTTDEESLLQQSCRILRVYLILYTKCYVITNVSEI